MDRRDGPPHRPVLLQEVLTLLAPAPGEIFLDGTIGFGGHASAILVASAPDGILHGLDLDPAALDAAAERLAPFGDRVRLERASYSDAAFPGPYDGVLLDLGVNSAQLDTASRGFSFRADGPLDMRLDPDAPRSAADLVNTAGEAELADIIFHFGEERFSRRIARKICRERRGNPIKNTARLADIVSGAVPRRGRIHPATRTFQALRIAVNGELDKLADALGGLPERLKRGGRVAIISFHSLEDRLVKRAFRDGARDGVFDILTPKPLTAGPAEKTGNPRSRSAKLRAARRTEGGRTWGDGSA